MLHRASHLTRPLILALTLLLLPLSAAANEISFAPTQSKIGDPTCHTLTRLADRVCAGGDHMVRCAEILTRITDRCTQDFYICQACDIAYDQVYRCGRNQSESCADVIGIVFGCVGAILEETLVCGSDDGGLGSTS